MIKGVIALSVAFLVILSFVSCGEAPSDESCVFDNSYTIVSEPIADRNGREENKKPPAADEIQQIAVRVVEIRENYIDTEAVYESDAQKFGRIRLNIAYPDKLLPEYVGLESILNVKYRGKIKPAEGNMLASINEITAIEYYGEQPEPKNASFCATVAENGASVLPLKGEWEAQYNYAFSISNFGKNQFKAGDLVCVTYSGIVLESDPPQLSQVQSVTLIDNSSLCDVTVFNDGNAEKTYNITPSSKTWNNGWVFADGTTWSMALQMYLQDIPTVYLKDSISFYILEKYRNNSSMLVLKSSTKLDGSEVIPDFDSCDPDRLNQLESGVYYVVIRALWYGEFIESEAEYPRDACDNESEYYERNKSAFENGCDEYIFRLIAS